MWNLLVDPFRNVSEVQKRPRLARHSRTESEDLDSELGMGEELPPPYSEVEEKTRGYQSPFISTPIAESPEKLLLEEAGEQQLDVEDGDDTKEELEDEEEDTAEISRDEVDEEQDGLLYKLKYGEANPNEDMVSLC